MNKEEEQEADTELGFETGGAALVSLAQFSSTPSARRLSSNFSQPSRPIISAKRLAWVSLQGRLVNAEEASSAKTFGLSRAEAVAWELFTPLQRFLIVAVIGVAVAESKKNRLIWQLTEAVELRDQVLSSMQQKLDNLCKIGNQGEQNHGLSSVQQKLDKMCEQVDIVRDHSDGGVETTFIKRAGSPCKEAFGSDAVKFVDCGCWLCDQHRDLEGNSLRKSSTGDEIIRYKISFSNDAEPEERRMSDLSDWASSVTSAADIQMNTLAVEQDIYNLKRDCEEKDATIKKLSTLLQSSDVAGSKRISELEEIIRRKNMIITRLKKDMVVLEQKVVHFTRLRRSSFSASDSTSEKLPCMTDNLLYDMDSTTSPSSSDSDCSSANRSHAHVAKIEEISVKNSNCASTRNQMSVPAKPSGSIVRPTDWRSKSRSVSPLKEISTNWKSDAMSSSRQKQLAGGDSRKSKRRHLAGSKDATPQKRWT
ncbi:hypothetical protein ACJW30_08G151800 [Castanea mollissima]